MTGQRTAVEEWQGERARFFEERRGIIGGSDAAAIMGLSRWGTPMDVWAEKVGLTEPPIDMPLRQWVGLRLEPLLAEMAAARTGRKFRRRHGLLRSKTYPFIGGHVDYAGLEVKTSYSAEGWGDDGRTISAADRDSWDAVPIDYLLQVQHYLYVTRWPTMTIAVLIGHDDFRTYDVRPIEALIVPLVAEEVRFWQEYVVTGSPPPLDASEGTKAYLRSKFPRALGQMRPATAEESALIEDIRRAGSAVVDAETEYETLRARLKAHIGDDMGLKAPGVTAVWGHVERKPETNWELVAASQRRILDALFEGRIAFIESEGGQITMEFDGAPLSADTVAALETLYSMPRQPYRRLDIRYSRRGDA